MINVMIKNLLAQAKRVDKHTFSSAKYFKYQIVFITEEGSYDTLGVDSLDINADFVSGHAEDTVVGVRMIPSLYYNVLIPNRDNLRAFLISDSGEQRQITEYVAIPLDPGDPKLMGTHSMTADVNSVSFTSMSRYYVQLLDPTYVKLRDVVVSGITLMGNVLDTASCLIDHYSKEVTEETEYEGCVFNHPIDNPTRYSSIVIPEGTELQSLPSFLQNDDRYGIYREGLGFYFKDKRWWGYSLFNITKYDSFPLVANVIRLPRDKFPTLEDTYFNDENGLTILATGDAFYEDNSDIINQDQGVGERLVAASRVAGNTGVHYNAGRSIQTRADSMIEFKLSERKSGQEYYPVANTPTNNPFKYASAISGNQGDILSIDWNNSNTSTILPGMPCRYQYMSEDKMFSRKGVILGFRTKHIIYNEMTLLMSSNTTIVMFLEKQNTEVI